MRNLNVATVLLHSLATSYTRRYAKLEACCSRFSLPVFCIQHGVLLLLISPEGTSNTQRNNESFIFRSVNMTSPIAVRILSEQDDTAPDENVGCLNLLYLDGNITLRLTFVNEEQARAICIDRMSSIKEQAASMWSDEMRPVLTSEFRNKANRFLEMVALAAECGFVTPSILSAKADLVALIDETG
jgi:hypothetical protein